ncbi:MAG: LrgB family protein [Muribaculaceae bacterium]
MIDEMLKQSVYLGVFLSLGAYGIGMWLKRITGWAIANPLFVAIVLVIIALALLGIDYESYCRSSNIITYLLTPSTICLAVPLHQQIELLKRNVRAVMMGIVAGVMSSLCIILLLSWLMHLDHASYVTFLPKSITTAIGMGVTEELGGYVPISVAVIIITGVIGGIIAEGWFKLLRITEPIARGIALGSSAHAIGTAKAMELGPVEGSMSSLSIVVCGVFTVIAAPFFAALW